MRVQSLFLVLFLATSGCAAGQPESTEVAAVPDDPGVPVERAAATEAAYRFLSQVDNGHTGQVWPELSVVMRGNIRQSDWEAVVGAMHSDIGSVRTRRLTKIGFTNGLGDIPDGRYYIIHFASDFERATAIEELMVSLEGGTWKVGGYFASSIQRK